MEKWEYCVISGVGFISSTLFPNYPELIFFSVDGITKRIDIGNNAAHKRPEKFVKASEGEYLAHIIAKLGIEGWEMICAVSQDRSSEGIGPHCIYFRRKLIE